MRLYVVAEDAGARVLLPAWIRWMAPALVQMQAPEDAADPGWFLLSAKGYPRVLHTLRTAIEDLAAHPGHFQALIVLVDSGESTAEERRAEILAASDGALCPVRVVVAHRCVESWALGNRRFVRPQPREEELRAWMDHYDVHALDPEGLPLRAGGRWNTVEQCAEAYLKAAHHENGLTYLKSKPLTIAQEGFFRQIEARREVTGHLASFQELLAVFRG